MFFLDRKYLFIREEYALTMTISWPYL